MEFVGLVCDGENDLQADGALGVLTAWPSAARGPASQGWSRGTGAPRPAGALWVSDSSDPMDCSLPGSSVHGIFQARVLEWGAIAFSSLKY